jgi:hypothetical protein
MQNTDYLLFALQSCTDVYSLVYGVHTLKTVFCFQFYLCVPDIWRVLTVLFVQYDS